MRPIYRFVKMVEIELAEPPPNHFWRLVGSNWYRFANRSSQTSPDEADKSPLLPNSPNDIASSGCRKRRRSRCRFKITIAVLVVLLLFAIFITHIPETLTAARSFEPVDPQALVAMPHPANSSTKANTTTTTTTTEASTSSLPTSQQQQWEANQSLTLLGNYSLGIEKRGHMLSGQIGNVNLCDEPTMKRSFPNLDYALKGYNYLKGFPISLEHDPGFSHQIFQVFFYFLG